MKWKYVGVRRHHRFGNCEMDKTDAQCNRRLSNSHHSIDEMHRCLLLRFHSIQMARHCSIVLRCVDVEWNTRQCHTVTTHKRIQSKMRFAERKGGQKPTRYIRICNDNGSNRQINNSSLLPIDIAPISTFSVEYQQFACKYTQNTHDTIVDEILIGRKQMTEQIERWETHGGERTMPDEAKLVHPNANNVQSATSNRWACRCFAFKSCVADNTSKFNVLSTYFHLTLSLSTSIFTIN